MALDVEGVVDGGVSGQKFSALRAMRLSPRYQSWQALYFSAALMFNGNYEAAVAAAKDAIGRAESDFKRARDYIELAFAHAEIRNDRKSEGRSCARKGFGSPLNGRVVSLEFVRIPERIGLGPVRQRLAHLRTTRMRSDGGPARMELGPLSVFLPRPLYRPTRHILS